MSLPISWKLLIISLLSICLFNFLTASVAHTSTNILEQPWKLLKEHRQTILQLSSDREAFQLHQSVGAQQTAHSSTHKKSPKNTKSFLVIPQEIETHINRFWATLTTIGFVQEVRATLDPSLHNPASKIRFPSETQLQWIDSKTSLEKFKSLIQLQQSLLGLPKIQTVAIPSNNDYAQFSEFHNQFNSNSDTQQWIDLLTNEGFNGIQNKLQRYWQQPNSLDSQSLISDSLKQSYIQYFIETKLFPLFNSHLLKQTIQVETQAYDLALKTWHRIQQWKEEEQTHLAMRRLCGTWKWLIHNHQNHGDHKTTMTFASPEESTPSQVQPSTILIHGDTVYLKWIFSQGIQEDSLLLSNRDTRLEGTFKNSFGPHGSISGKRLSSCKN